MLHMSRHFTSLTLAPPPVCVLLLPLQVCSWYDGPTLFETLDTVEVQQR